MDLQNPLTKKENILQTQNKFLNQTQNSKQAHGHITMIAT
jgi:hypothetical protein